MTSFKKLFGPQAVSLLIAVLAATVMWYMVCVRDRIEAQYEVFVDYHGVSPKLVITEGLVSKITIRLRGPETLLRSYGNRRLTHQVDLSKVKKGVTVVPITPEDLHLDQRVFDIIDIDPARMVVKADNLAERIVPVKSDVKSPLRDGILRVDGVSTSPSSVTIKGPEAIVADISSLKLPIQLDPKAAGTKVDQMMKLDTPNLVTATPS
ncbi:MAG: YbbR-like domain-containing protein, partial [Desulfovibrio sp.]|nr:YbbR-like domain-containing protein [Desulfovibrio sp.]